MHFDKNRPTTCYLPLNTLWAGDGYGIRFTPRVNSEVIVGFLNGDIDRPIIIGSLHNGENKIPYALPDTKTQSYIKTQTTPQYTDQEGYNEILFEDKPYNELLNLRAQKDYNLLVLNDATEQINHDRTKIVDNNETCTIKGYQTHSVHKAKSENITLASALSIGAAYQVTVGASKNESVGINSSEEVGIYKYTLAGSKYELQVGNTKITLFANGDVCIEGDNVELTATEYLAFKAPKIDIKNGSNNVAIQAFKNTITNNEPKCILCEKLKKAQQ